MITQIRKIIVFNRIVLFKSFSGQPDTYCHDEIFLEMEDSSTSL